MSKPHPLYSANQKGKSYTHCMEKSEGTVITEMYPSVAYHNEPLFLKTQELIKLILAAEWLMNEKAVKEWMMRYSTAPKQKGAVAVAKSLRSKAKRPPREFVPSPTVVNRPSSDVTVKTVKLLLSNTGIVARALLWVAFFKD